MPLQLMNVVHTISHKRLPFFMRPFIGLYVKGLDELLSDHVSIECYRLQKKIYPAHLGLEAKGSLPPTF